MNLTDLGNKLELSLFPLFCFTCFSITCCFPSMCWQPVTCSPTQRLFFHPLQTLHMLCGSCFLLAGKRRGLRQELLVEYSSLVLQHMVDFLRSTRNWVEWAPGSCTFHMRHMCHGSVFSLATETQIYHLGASDIGGHIEWFLQYHWVTVQTVDINTVLLQPTHTFLNTLLFLTWTCTQLFLLFPALHNHTAANNRDVSFFVICT